VSDQITIDDFKKVELRVAVVKSVEPHPNADKLLVLKVDMGGAERQLVAGIRGHYEPQALVGRRIIVVANLQPAVLRGVESQGMLLAARDGAKIVLLTTDQEVAPGSGVS
jgi:methionyl-tRNA synthetase